MSRIFISYRRDDSADVTGRIFDRLIAHFNKDNVFKDVDSIPYGVNFEKHLASVVEQCEVVLVVIGPRWVDITGDTGQRRLDDPGDYVRIEVETALKRDIPVIPLLVKGAPIPAPDELPPGIAELALRNGMPVRRDPDFHTDVDRLIDGLKEYVSTPRQQVAGFMNRLKDELEDAVGPRVEQARERLEGLGAGSEAAPTESESAQAAPAPAEGRLYDLADANLSEMADELQNWFVGHEYEAQVLEEEGTFVVQGRKGQENILRSVTGLRYVATVVLQPAEGGFRATVGGGEWANKAAVAVVGGYLTLGVTTLTAGYGAFQQKKLENDLWHQIDLLAASRGGKQVT